MANRDGATKSVRVIGRAVHGDYDWCYCMDTTMMEKFIITMLVFSAVNIVCSFVNLTGAILGLRCPPFVPWLAGWWTIGIGLGLFVAFRFA